MKKPSIYFLAYISLFLLSTHFVYTSYLKKRTVPFSDTEEIIKEYSKQPPSLLCAYGLARNKHKQETIKVSDAFNKGRMRVMHKNIGRVGGKITQIAS